MYTMLAKGEPFEDYKANQMTDDIMGPLIVGQMD